MNVASSITALALLSAPLLGSARLPAPAALATEDAMEVSLMELTTIDWDPGKKLPKKIEKLGGKKVRLKGFMALDTPEGVSKFRLTYDQCGCSNAKASHFVEVDLGDEETGYDPAEMTVVGTLSVGEEKEDGFVTSLYRLDADSLN